MYYVYYVYTVDFFIFVESKNVVRKNIDIDANVLTKLKVLSVFENMSVKALMEKAISFFVEYKEGERLNALSDEEKEDLGLLLLMQQADRTQKADLGEVMDFLDS